MTLDERAAQATEGIRRAVQAVELTTQHGDDTPQRRLHRRQRRSLVFVAALTAGVIAGVFGLAHVLSRPSPSPITTPSRLGGLILYGQWHPSQQQSSWFTVHPDGTGRTDLHLTSTCASWWPGGGKILISLDADVPAGHPLRPATVNPDGSGLHRLNATRAPRLNLGCGQASPDGQHIVLEGFGQTPRSHVNGIYLVRAADGGGLFRVAHTPVGTSDGPPRYAPDGRHIVFLRISRRSSVEGAGALYVTTTTGSRLRPITPEGFAFLGYDWSPDGRWIVFQRPYGQLYVVHPDGSQLHRVPLDLPAGSGAENPVWASDSKTIAFSLSHNGHANVYTVEIGGTHLRQVTHGSGAEQTPDWSH